MSPLTFASRLIRVARNLKRRLETRQPARPVEVTIESHRVLVVQYRSETVQVCSQCGERVEAVELEHAADYLRTSPGTVQRWVEEERLHSIEAGGQHFICRRSLINTDIAEVRIVE